MSDTGTQEPLPTKIDRYEPLKRLATGGMAEIFLAKQSGLEGFEKVVVLKRILSHLASDEEFVSMFLDEARIAAKLSHPNIVQIYDLGKTDSSYYIAMEYVSGRNVQHLINKQQARGGHLPVEHVIRIMAGVCDGLFYAHSRKDYDGKPLSIIHRDISPQNILVSFAGGVKVVDFGIAKASTQLAQTRAGVLKGKYAYMSPEQVRGAKIDHRSDLFAVGLVMYEMLTGMRAFERDSSLKTLKAIVQEKPLNPREMNPEIPMEVVKLLSKALEKNPDRRYKTAQEMQLALEDWLESSPKKSNNVRLSRFLYDLFDDELQSAEGTMVVKGVGQVIIPTSQGAAQAKPAVEEEIDSKTLSAALVDGAPAPGAPPPPPAATAKPAASGRVRDELSNKQPAVAAKPAPTPKPAAPPPPKPMVDESEENDGKTVPGYDLEQLERDRVAAMQKKGIPTTASPQRGANNPVTAEEADDEDKTRAGVPMSASSPPQPPPPPKGRAPDDSDARARAMLEKVDSLAPPTLSRPTVDAAKARTASLPDQQALSAASSLLDEDPLPAPTLNTAQPSVSGMSGAAGKWDGSTKETAKKASMSGDDMIIGSGGPVGGGREPSRQNRTAAAMPVVANDGSDDLVLPTWSPPQPQAQAAPTASSTMELEQPTPTPTLASPSTAAPQTSKTVFMALGASAGMTVMALVLFVVGAVAFEAVPATDYGVVVVEVAQPGAFVMYEGAKVDLPGQLAVPLDGVERTVEIQLAGYKTQTAKLVFAPGTETSKIHVALDPS